MAQTTFSIVNNQTFTNSGITQNGVYDLHVSSPQNNTINFPNLRVVVDYHEVAPTYLPGGLAVTVEANNGNIWYPIAYQFEPYRNIDNGTQRIIMVQPDMNTYNDGIDSIVYVGGSTIARISRQQGRAATQFRTRLVLQENNYGTSSAFTSARISIYGDLSD